MLKLKLIMIKHFGLLELETWLSPTIDYCRTENTKIGRSDHDLFKTSKITKNGPVTAEKLKNEKILNFYWQKFEGFREIDFDFEIY